MGKIIEIPFSENLIRWTANRLMEQDSLDFSSNAVIFSHHRPGHYLHKSMAESLKHSFFPPQIFSMDNFMLSLSVAARTAVDRLKGLEACSTDIVKPIDSIYLLFQVVCRLPDNPWKNLSLNQFIPWGLKIAQVISELDIEMISDSELHSIELREDLQAETWGNISNHLSQIRREYHSILKNLNLTTRALTYCFAANNIQHIDLSLFKHIYFVGLFAMTKSEKMVVQHLLRQAEATIIRQGDGREWTPFKEMDKWAEREEIEEIRDDSYAPIDNCQGDSPEIFLYSAFNTHSEVVALRDVLMDEAAPLRDIEHLLCSSAIVLPCSETVIPLLSEVMTALPVDYNISLGYPIIRTPVSALLNVFVGLYKNKKGTTYYIEDYLNLLMHPYIKNIHDSTQTRILVHAVESVLLDEKKRFISMNELEQDSRIFETASRLSPSMSPLEFREILTNIHNLFIKGMDRLQTLGQMAGFFEDVLTFLLKNSPAPHYPFSSEFFHKFFAFIDEIKTSMISSQCFENTIDLLEVFLHLIKDEQVYFEGSPIKGLQILGMLETRSLNFDRIFIMDVNENVLPSIEPSCPLLPLPVRQALNMPTYYQREEISKYHFRHLVASSGEVHIIYQETEKMRRSRFVEELVWEKEKSCGKLNALETKPVTINISLAPSHSLTIHKTPEIVDVLQTMKFSPSSMDTYIQCPAKFYFSNVLRLKEKKDIADDIDAADAGTILHRVMEILYKPLIGKDGIRYDYLENNIEMALNKVFEEMVKEIRGKEYLLKKLMFKQIENYLAWEKGHFNDDTRRVVSVEAKFEMLDSSCTLRLKGKLDRIDCHDKGYEIIDYKSGDITAYAFKCFDRVLVSREEMRKEIASLQLPCYVLLYHQSNPDIPIDKINSRLISIQSHEEKILFNDKDTLSRDTFLMDVFQPTLSNLVCEIMDPCLPFAADGDEEACRNCAFLLLCQRQGGKP